MKKRLYPGKQTSFVWSSQSMFCTILFWTNNTGDFGLLCFENSILGRSSAGHAQMYWTDEKLDFGLESIFVHDRMEELCMISHFLYACALRDQYVFCLSRIQVCVWTSICRNCGLGWKKNMFMISLLYPKLKHCNCFPLSGLKLF